MILKIKIENKNDDDILLDQTLFAAVSSCTIAGKRKTYRLVDCLLCLKDNYWKPSDISIYTCNNADYRIAFAAEDMSDDSVVWFDSIDVKVCETFNFPPI